MKLKYICFCIILISCNNLYAQIQSNDIANKQAKKMTQILNLHDSLSIKLYTINQSLINSKMYVRSKRTVTDSLAFFIQKIENNRDTMYSSILSHEQYLLYKLKKDEILKSDR